MMFALKNLKKGRKEQAYTWNYFAHD